MGCARTRHRTRAARRVCRGVSLCVAASGVDQLDEAGDDARGVDRRDDGRRDGRSGPVA